MANDGEQQLPIINEQMPAPPRISIESSHLPFRIWKTFNILTSAFVLVLSSYLFGFAPLISRAWDFVDLVTCVLFLIDIGVSFLATYIDNRTNTHVRGWSRVWIFFARWSTLRVIGVVPALFFPNVAKKYWYMTRIIHIGEVLNATTYLKMDKYPKINAGIKWARIVFVTIFSIHLMGSVFYYIGITNSSPPTWITSLADQQLENEENKNFFRYIMSIYWATTVLTTVGFGDYHAVNGREMVFSVIALLIYMVLNPYITNVVSELLQGSHLITKFREESELLREFVTSHRLPDALHRLMYNFLIKTRDNQVEKRFDIQTLFSDDIQFRVKNAFSAHIRNSYLFNGVSITLIRLLVSEMKLEIFESNDTILLANQYSKKIYVRVEGGIEGTGLRNPQLTVCGEFGVVCGLPQPYDVRTNNRTTVLCLSRKRFYRLMESNKLDAQTIASNLLENLEGEGGDPNILRQVRGKFNRGEINLHVDIRFACERSFSKLLLRLIKSGEDVEEVYEQQRNILQIVIEERRPEYLRCVKILLREMTLPSINKRDTFGNTPLCYAIQRRERLLIDLFQQRGITLEHDEVVGYYFKAVEETDVILLNFIKDLGGDINVQAKVTKRSPIHLAVRIKNAVMVRKLLDLGADIDLVDATGISARRYAAEHDGYEDILALF